MSLSNSRKGRGGHNRKEKNRPAPPSSFSKLAADEAATTSSREVRNVTTAADYAELERSYTFVPPPSSSNNSRKGSGSGDTTTWQERMVQHYHSHLYKEYVLADLRRLPQVGLRWRTQAEVQSGKGHSTCGNKHCPSYIESNNNVRADLQDSNNSNRALLAAYYQSARPSKEVQERLLLEGLPYGLGLHDYEVNFAYVESGEQKNELVKLRLCLRCAPKLFQTKGGALGARRAREAMVERTTTSDGTKEATATTRTGQSSADYSSSEEESSKNRKQGESRGKLSKRRRKREKREVQGSSSGTDDELALSGQSKSSHSRPSRHHGYRSKKTKNKKASSRSSPRRREKREHDAR